MDDASGPLWAVLPVKPFAEAKSRLAPGLRPDQRRLLARNLFAHTIEAVQDSGSVQTSLVVSRDPDALAIAASRGLETLLESGPSGLNEALSEARRLVEADALLVIATDLPLLSAIDIESFVAAAHGKAVTIAPDHRGEGTNAILLRPPDAIEFAFGPASRRRHLALAAARGLAVKEWGSPGLALDLDLPEDLSTLLAQGWVAGRAFAAT